MWLHYLWFCFTHARGTNCLMFQELNNKEYLAACNQCCSVLVKAHPLLFWAVVWFPSVTKCKIVRLPTTLKNKCRKQGPCFALTQLVTWGSAAAPQKHPPLLCPPSKYFQCPWVQNEHLLSFWLVYRAFLSPVGVRYPCFVCVVQLGTPPCMCSASFSCTDSATTIIVCTFAIMFTTNRIQNLFSAGGVHRSSTQAHFILSHEMCYVASFFFTCNPDSPLYPFARPSLPFLWTSCTHLPCSQARSTLL